MSDFQKKKINPIQLKTGINKVIQDNLNDNSLDKYKNWCKKLGLVLLNALFSIPLITLAIKYHTTGSCLFSLKGKSQEALEKVSRYSNSI